MTEQSENQNECPKHELEQLLEAIVINCQHIAAIMKGSCVKGVSHDVSLAELAKRESTKNSESHNILKAEYENCKKLMSECLISIDKMKREYLAEYNRGNAPEEICHEKGAIHPTLADDVQQSGKGAPPASIPEEDEASM
tara:strand:+ start:539 stop:958 length:420 start_codon:yes stop_codon:yes gene_type:complete